MKRVLIPLGGAALCALLALACYLAVDAERRARLARPDVIHFSTPVSQYGGYVMVGFCALASLLTLYAVARIVIDAIAHVQAIRDR